MECQTGQYQGSSLGGPIGQWHERFPNEIIDIILWQLDLPSIKNLRLTCKAAALKSQSPGFKRFFAHKTIELTQEDTTTTLALALHPEFGPAVKHLTMMVVVYDESRWAWAYRNSLRSISDVSEQAIQDVAEELDQVLRLSQMHETSSYWLDHMAVWDLGKLFNKLGRLDSLTLDTRTYQEIGSPDLSIRRVPEGMNWQKLWTCCTYGFRNVMLSVLNSDIKIEHLSLFDGKDAFPVSGKVQSEMLSLTATRILAAREGISTPASPVKNLTLGFSTLTDEVASYNQLDHHASDLDFLCRPIPVSSPAVLDPDSLSGPGELLKLLPGLEGLDLRMYNTLDGTPTGNHRVLADVRLSGLRRLTLRGLYTREAHILRLLRANRQSLESLDLREVHLGGHDSWKVAFRFLSRGGAPQLRALHLEGLWDGAGALINLEPRDAAFDDGRRGRGASFQTRGGETLVHTRDIGMEELAGGLEFKTLSSQHGKGSGALRSWLRERKVLYGPPDSKERVGLE